MTPQEKDLLTTLPDRLRNTPRQPKDPEADALIRQAANEQLDLPYYLIQTVLIQDLSLHQAQQRIADLERQVADAQQSAKPAGGSFLGGLLANACRHPPPGVRLPVDGRDRRRSLLRRRRSLMDNNRATASQPLRSRWAVPVVCWAGRGAMGGGGFLRSAAATAAGVAGGALLFQASPRCLAIIMPAA